MWHCSIEKQCCSLERPMHATHMIIMYIITRPAINMIIRPACHKHDMPHIYLWYCSIVKQCCSLERHAYHKCDHHVMHMITRPATIMIIRPACHKYDVPHISVALQHGKGTGCSPGRPACHRCGRPSGPAIGAHCPPLLPAACGPLAG